MCETLDIPKSTYYQSLHKTESNRERENRKFTELIKQIHEESKKRYGAPKIHEMLEKQGHKTSLKRVQRRKINKQCAKTYSDMVHLYIKFQSLHTESM